LRVNPRAMPEEAGWEHARIVKHEKLISAEQFR
jgi:hypothetical protein